jgi:hypothetical protein
MLNYSMTDVGVMLRMKCRQIMADGNEKNILTTGQ